MKTATRTEQKRMTIRDILDVLRDGHTVRIVTGLGNTTSQLSFIDESRFDEPIEGPDAVSLALFNLLPAGIMLDVEIEKKTETGYATAILECGMLKDMLSEIAFDAVLDAQLDHNTEITEWEITDLSLDADNNLTIRTQWEASK